MGHCWDGPSSSAAGNGAWICFSGKPLTSAGVQSTFTEVKALMLADRLSAINHGTQPVTGSGGDRESPAR